MPATAFGTFIAQVFGFAGGAAAAQGLSQLGILLARYAIVSAASQALTKQTLTDTGGVGARDVVISNSTSPQQVVYGTALTAGVLIYYNALPDDGNGIFDLHIAIAHAGHECEDIQDIWYDDTQIPDADITWGTSVDDGDFGPRHGIVSVVPYQHLGTSTQTVNTALEAAYTEWTSAHRLRGICYTVHVLRLHEKNQEQWEGGQPQNIRVLVVGKNDIYDPALDASPGADPDNASFQAHTDNPVLCVADYMRTYMDVANASFDWTDIETEAAICDATVAIPTAATEARYTCNGALSLGDTHATNLEKLLSSCNGWLTKASGLWQIKAGAYQTPTVTLDDDDIVGAPQWRKVVPAENRVNTMSAIYNSKGDDYKDVESIEVTDAAFLTRDNSVVLPKTVALSFTNSETQAQRQLFKMLDQGNQQGVLEVPLRWAGAAIMPGTGVTLTYTPFGAGFASKIFRCLGVTIGERDAPAIAILKEDASTAWDDPLEGAYSTRTAAGALVAGTPIIFNDLPDPSDLYAYYPLDHITLIQNRAAGSTVGDGVVTGALVLGTGPADKALIFDGTNDHVTLMTDAEADTWMAGDFSLAMWFRSDTAAGGVAETIFSRDESTAYEVRIDQSQAQGSQTVELTYWNGASATNLALGEVLDGWNHVAIARSSGTLSCFLNGVQGQSATNFALSADVDSVVIGNNAGGLTRRFTGRLYGVRCYTSEITEYEARALYLNPDADGEGIGAAIIGTNVYSSTGEQLNDVDLANDYLVQDALGGALNLNHSFSAAHSPSGNLRPRNWYIAGNAETDVAYASTTSRDTIDVDGNGEIADLIGAAFPVQPLQKFWVTIRARSDGTDTISFWMQERPTSLGQMATGEFAFFDGADAATYSDSEIDFNVSHTSTLLANQVLTGSMATYQFEYEVPASTEYLAPLVVVQDTEHVELDYFIVTPWKFEADTGDLVDDAATVDGYAESTAVSMAFTTFTTVETVTLEVPNPLPAGTSAVVFCTFEWYVEAQDAFETSDGDLLADTSMSIRILDDDNVAQKTKTVEMRMARDQNGANFWNYQSVTIEAEIENANLNTGTNTFDLQVDFLDPLTNIATVSGQDITMWALLRKK